MTSPPVRPPRRRNVIPGFGLTFGISALWLSIIVLIPLATIFLRSAHMGLEQFIAVGLSPRALEAYRLSFGTAAAAGVVNAIFGVVVAWVLVRYDFIGKRLVGAIVDLPFALPTAVAGIALTAIYAPNGWIGQLFDPLGIRIAFTPIGITIALIFIGLPFVVRSVEPVLADLGRDVEEAAATLGASRWQTFSRVILPAIGPALLTGFALTFARGVGEYGSVIFIAGNIQGSTEIAPLLIVTQLEQYNYDGATAIAVVMLLVSFGVLLGINLSQVASRRRMGA
ncbi:sulfate ABC transporter permease subunit CysT [Altererythrobacter xixiisoli]|uniref:Sulfate transport system permease protein CysT n=1 Tax=Croceibacterium xixiisoli TaxID=1476466 RepID=A0A6I4TUM0_9SPHN|nr:sulfate ABC transporter permease subunit CysT [Croceibacterium xixiisoli]MXO97963.1 sulfate ABC transporter permease subunit CysT [Croceibacterium xixiisoli]